MTINTWSTARKHAFVVGTLRAGSRRWPARYQTLIDAKTDKKINPHTNRMAQHYKCAACQQEYPAKDVAVDHIIPVVDPAVGFTTWDEYIERLFCEQDNLQVLCSDCHDKKTAEERKQKVKKK